MLHFVPFLSIPFGVYALNSFLLFTSFSSNLQFISCFEHYFFQESVRMEPQIISGFCFWLKKTQQLKTSSKRKASDNQNTHEHCPNSLNQDVPDVMKIQMTIKHCAICSSRDTHIQQGRCESSGWSARQEGTPSKSPGLLDAFHENPRHFSAFGLGQEAHKRASFLRPTATCFSCQDHQTTTGIATSQLRIHRLLLPPNNFKDCHVDVCCASLWGPAVETPKVVSTASCTAPKSGNRSATISSLRASRAFNTGRSMSLTIMLTVTLAPPSRQMRPTALSTANPRRPKTPALEHDARWWP